MRKFAVLFIAIFAFVSYAETNEETHEEKVMHSIYDMSIIEKQLEAYKKEKGEYPKTHEGLEKIKKYNVTVVPDHIIPNRYMEGNVDNRKFKWEGYKFPDADLVDGWGRKYEYKSNGIKYSIHSYGEDGVAGGTGAGADIVIYSSK